LQENKSRTNRKNFTKRYNEHKRAFRNNSHSSKFAQHLNEHTNSFGAINDIMQILHYQKKGPNLNTRERFYIHTKATSNNHLNDNQTIYPNRIFDTIPKIYHPQLLPPYTFTTSSLPPLHLHDLQPINTHQSLHNIQGNPYTTRNRCTYIQRFPLTK